MAPSGVHQVPRAACCGQAALKASPPRGPPRTLGSDAGPDRHHEILGAAAEPRRQDLDHPWRRTRDAATPSRVHGGHGSRACIRVEDGHAVCRAHRERDVRPIGGQQVSLGPGPVADATPSVWTAHAVHLPHAPQMRLLDAEPRRQRAPTRAGVGMRHVEATRGEDVMGKGSSGSQESAGPHGVSIQANGAIGAGSVTSR